MSGPPLPDGTLAAIAALVPLLVGTGAGAVALTGVRRLETPSLVLMVLAGAAWLLLNEPIEGPVLVVFTPDHGLTLADLVALPAALVVSCLLVERGRCEAREQAVRRGGAG
ncbi:MAG: hypothetical protein JWM64_309 [Frankiales bacterium]|nr:hypothetical protein [Frankiales bacterium]